MLDPDTPLTTGQVATICRLSIQTVIGWCDAHDKRSGNGLNHYRIPGSSHRRVLVKVLRAYMVEHNLPVEWLDGYISKQPSRGGWV